MNAFELIQDFSQKRWSAERARKWYDLQPWLVGCNFNPSNASNQLEMWQAETFSPEVIDRELGWLAGIGMNSMRVFLHDLLWFQDAEGFLARIDQFLSIAAKHGIGTMFVFFDSCWDSSPKLGPQRAPAPGVHNSCWVQSPGSAVVIDPAAFDRLEGYVKGVMNRFRDDQRVHVWDLWNEPDNLNAASYGSGGITPEQMKEMILPLLAKTFDWARSVDAGQPLTSGVWAGEWSEDKIEPLARFQLLASDVVSFHTYVPADETRVRIDTLNSYGRPLLCTEYLARGAGSTFEAILSLFKQEKVAAYNWGAVSGKTQTIYAWDSWQNPGLPEPEVWHHDILRPDGTPYKSSETQLIQSLTQSA